MYIYIAKSNIVKKFYHLVLCITVLTSCTTHNPSIQSSGTIGNHAMGSSAHPLASAIGLEIMKMAAMRLMLRLPLILHWRLFIHRPAILAVADLP
jgi:hypothetical protein